MRHLLRRFAILTSLILLSAASSYGQSGESEQGGKQPPRSTRPTRPERMIPIGVFGGKVLEVDEEGKSFKLRVYGTTPVMRFTPGNPEAC
jgi:hypothetical protein